jgi:predicted dehydrogenase
MRSFNDTFASRIRAWVEDIRNRTASEKIDAKADDALAAQRVIEAAIESWETGTVVEL